MHRGSRHRSRGPLPMWESPPWPVEDAAGTGMRSPAGRMDVASRRGLRRWQAVALGQRRYPADMRPALGTPAPRPYLSAGAGWPGACCPAATHPFRRQDACAHRCRRLRFIAPAFQPCGRAVGAVAGRPDPGVRRAMSGTHAIHRASGASSRSTSRSKHADRSRTFFAVRPASSWPPVFGQMRTAPARGLDSARIFCP